MAPSPIPKAPLAGFSIIEFDDLDEGEHPNKDTRRAWTFGHRVGLALFR
jgi:hypothetical protein